MLSRALGGSAARAFFMMSNFGRYGQVNSTTYAIARQEYAELAAVQMKGRTMPPVSDETRQKQSQAKLGKKLTPEHIEKVRQARIGKKMSPEFRKNVSQAKRGIATRGSGWSHSDETLAKMAASNRNRPMITCPHCTKTVKDHGGAKRWHFDRCKERIEA
jgi:sigma54-dependent transcription regulator